MIIVLITQDRRVQRTFDIKPKSVKIKVVQNCECEEWSVDRKYKDDIGEEAKNIINNGIFSGCIVEKIIM